MAPSGWGVVLAVAMSLLVAGRASARSGTKRVNVGVDGSSEQKRSDTDTQKFTRGVNMILKRNVQAAIDLRFDAVVNRYEVRYGRAKETRFSA